MRVEERVQARREFFKPEVASLNMGSMNFALFPMLGPLQELQVRLGSSPISKARATSSSATRSRTSNSSSKTCQDNGTRFEFECYDIGHLYNLAHFLDRGLVKPPLFVQSVFGILGGIGTHPEDVMHMRRTADRLFGARELPVVRARRRPQPDADRRHGGRDGRQCAGRA